MYYKPLHYSVFRTYGTVSSLCNSVIQKLMAIGAQRYTKAKQN